jgi:hypothetical protein
VGKEGFYSLQTSSGGANPHYGKGLFTPWFSVLWFDLLHLFFPDEGFVGCVAPVEEASFA